MSFLEQSCDGMIAIDKLIVHTKLLNFIDNFISFSRLSVPGFPTVESGAFNIKAVQNDGHWIDFLIFFHQLDKTYFVDGLIKLRYFLVMPPAGVTVPLRYPFTVVTQALMETMLLFLLIPSHPSINLTIILDFQSLHDDLIGLTCLLHLDTD